MSLMSMKKLGELIEIKHGFAFSSAYFVDRGPYVLLTPGNFYDEGGFKFRETQKFYDGPVPAQFELKPGDLLVAMTEQAEGLLGSAAFVPGGSICLHNQRLGLVRPRDGAAVDLRYIYYLFNSRAVRQQIRASASGTKIRHTAPNRIYDVNIPTMPLPNQVRVAAILGAYDDLIEVNRRRMALLENMARSLFEEWFVRFRFPGHEDVAIGDTPDGPLPNGWEWSSASCLVTFDPKTRLPREGEKPFISMGHLDTSTSVIAMHEWREGNSGAKFQTGDVLFARITPCLENGKTGLVRDLPGGVGFGSTEFIVMRKARAGSSFAYCLARSEGFRANAVRGMSGATGRQRARTDHVASFIIASPPGSELFDRFEAAAAPMLNAVGGYAKANALLASSRDLLLPRLISGQLSIAKAERELLRAA